MNLTDRTINPLTTRRAVFSQQENAAVPYRIDYAAMLNGDTILASGWSCSQGGLSIDSGREGAVTAATISGQPGRYTVVNKITTAVGLVDEWLLVITIKANEEGAQGGYR